jgi:hypothetical protein
MPVPKTEKWYHSNQYTAETQCTHCAGNVYHEPWCISQNKVVAYAYGTVLDANRLTVEDRLILHALGVSWKNNVCQGNCG